MLEIRLAVIRYHFSKFFLLNAKIAFVRHVGHFPVILHIVIVIKKSKSRSVSAYHFACIALKLDQQNDIESGNALPV